MNKDLNNYEEARDYLFKELNIIADIKWVVVGSLISSSYVAEYTAKGIEFDDDLIDEKTSNDLIAYVNYYKKTKYINDIYIKHLINYLRKLNIKSKSIIINFRYILDFIAILKMQGRCINPDLEDLESKIMFNRNAAIRDFVFRYVSFNKEDVYRRNIKPLINLKEKSKDDFYMNLLDLSYSELDNFMRSIFKY